MNLAFSKIQVSTPNLSNLDKKHANRILAASGGRDLGGHKIGYISLSSSSIVTIFFLIGSLKIVLSFKTYNLSVFQAQCHLAAKLSKNCCMGPTLGPRWGV